MACVSNLPSLALHCTYLYSIEHVQWPPVRMPMPRSVATRRLKRWLRQPRRGAAPHPPWPPERNRFRSRTQGSSNRTARPARSAPSCPSAPRDAKQRPTQGPGPDPAAPPTLLVETGLALSHSQDVMEGGYTLPSAPHEELP